MSNFMEYGFVVVVVFVLNAYLLNFSDFFFLHNMTVVVVIVTNIY